MRQGVNMEKMMVHAETARQEICKSLGDPAYGLGWCRWECYALDSRAAFPRALYWTAQGICITKPGTGLSISMLFGDFSLEHTRGTPRGGLVVVQDGARVTLYSARQVERALATGKSGKMEKMGKDDD